MEATQSNMTAGSAEVRVVSASVIAQLQAQGLQVRLYLPMFLILILLFV